MKDKMEKFYLKLGRLSFRISKIYDRRQLDCSFYRAKSTDLIKGWILKFEISYYGIFLTYSYKDKKEIKN